MTNQPATRLDAIVTLSAEISRLRDELRRKEETLITLVGGNTAVPVRHHPDSIAQKIRDYVTSNPEKILPIEQIITAHPRFDAATIRSTVHRLAHGGLPGFVMAARGVYRYDHEAPFADTRVGVQLRTEGRS